MYTLQTVVGVEIHSCIAEIKNKIFTFATLKTKVPPEGANPQLLKATLKFLQADKNDDADDDNPDAGIPQLFSSKISRAKNHCLIRKNQILNIKYLYIDFGVVGSFAVKHQNNSQ